MSKMSKIQYCHFCHDIQPFKHVAGIVPIQLAVVDQAFVKLQHRSCSVPCPRADHLTAAINLRNAKTKIVPSCIQKLICVVTFILSRG